MSYFTVIGATTADLLDSWGCHASFCGVYSMTGVLVVLVVLPVCLLRHYGHLKDISYMSIGTIVMVLVLVVIGGPFTRSNGAVHIFIGKG